VPTKQSAIKRVRQNARRRLRNRTVKSEMRTAVKKAREEAGNKDAQNVNELISKAQSLAGRAAKRKTIHPRKAARLTSRLMKKANAAKAKPAS